MRYKALSLPSIGHANALFPISDSFSGICLTTKQLRPCPMRRLNVTDARHARIAEVQR